MHSDSTSVRFPATTILNDAACLVTDTGRQIATVRNG